MSQDEIYTQCPRYKLDPGLREALYHLLVMAINTVYVIYFDFFNFAYNVFRRVHVKWSNKWTML